MSRFEPKNPDFRAVAIDTFVRQRAMRTLGIRIARLEPGEVDLAMDYSPDFTQQHGFVHAGIITAGLDNACGIAAFTLMPPDTDILTVEDQFACARARRALCVPRYRGEARPHVDGVRGEGLCRA
jgi:acyl-coenzyme A thioesterase PaaI-like protein